MKKVSAFFALLMVAALLVSLVACGTSDASSAAPQGSSAQTSSAASTGDAQTPAPTGNTYTLMAQQGAVTGDWNDYWLFQKINEDTGLQFDITMVSLEGLQEKKNLSLATGDYPDFFLAGILTAEDIANYSAQGVFIPLEDYINEEYTPNLMAAFEKYPDLKASLYSPDGHIYNITGLNAGPAAFNRFNSWINVDWAAALDVPVPTTLDEFYNYLVAVKNGDPNGNGEADEIPFGGRYDNEYFANLACVLTAFGLCEKGWEVQNGTVQYNPAMPIYKDFLAFMNKMYTEGLLDPEYFTQSDEQFFAKQVQNQYGVFADYAHWVRMYNEENVWGQYDGWAPMTSEFNATPIWPAYDVSPLGAFVITDKCADPQDLMRLVDWFYDQEHSDWSIQGVPVGMWPEDASIGFEFVPVEGGKVIEHHWPEEYEDYQTFKTQRLTADYGTFPNIPSTDLIASGPQGVLEDAIGKYRTPYYKVGWPSIKYTGEEADEIALIQVDITSYADQMISRFIVGEVSLDEFDTFVQGLKDRNLDRLIEIQQGAYDRWANS